MHADPHHWLRERYGVQAIENKKNSIKNGANRSEVTDSSRLYLQEVINLARLEIRLGEHASFHHLIDDATVMKALRHVSKFNPAECIL